MCDQLALYACDGNFYWGFEVDAMPSRVWRGGIAVDDFDLSKTGDGDERCALIVCGVVEGMQLFCGGLRIEHEVDVDLWKYHYFEERYYVASLCRLQAETLQAWSGQYMFHTDAVLWEREIFQARFWYERRTDDAHWFQRLSWERWKLSGLGRLFPYYLCSF